MLVAHLSDLHLGYSQFNLEEREEDVYDAFREAIDISVRERVGLVLFAGDLFHIPRPSGKAILRLGNALKELKEKQIPAAFVLGEHDISRTRDVPMPYLFSNLGLARHLKVTDSVRVGDSAVVVGADKVRRGNADELAAKIEQARQTVKDHEGKKKILVLHQGLSDINKFAGEMNATDLPAEFDYYAMGHYHDHEERKYDFLGGPVVYPGSIDLTPSEGIKDVEKGFVIADFSGNEVSTSWIKLSRRKQFSQRIAYSDISNEVDRLIAKAQSMLYENDGKKKKPVARIEVAGMNIDSSIIANNLRRLNEVCLHYIWQPIEENTLSPIVYDHRPQDIDMELYNRSAEVLGSSELAAFAVNELLPAAGDDADASEGLKIVWDAYKKGRFATKKSDNSA